MSVSNIKALRARIVALNRQTAKGFARGLLKAGLLLQRESMKLVPIDTGVLRNTANTRAEGSGFDTRVIVSYGTDYAIFVHEDLEARHKPGKTAKFLETPLREKRQLLIKVVMDEVKKELGGNTP